ncbi:hypothetical protein JHK87_040352 [Glycine soja]|nr:hypothetical protein JHK87_040352 [Glycine soja]
MQEWLKATVRRRRWSRQHLGFWSHSRQKRSIEGPTVQNAESAVGSNDCGTTAQPEDQNHTCMEEIEEHCWSFLIIPLHMVSQQSPFSVHSQVTSHSNNNTVLSNLNSPRFLHRDPKPVLPIDIHRLRPSFQDHRPKRQDRDALLEAEGPSRSEACS